MSRRTVWNRETYTELCGALDSPRATRHHALYEHISADLPGGVLRGPGREGAGRAIAPQLPAALSQRPVPPRWPHLRGLPGQSHSLAGRGTRLLPAGPGGQRGRGRHAGGTSRAGPGPGRSACSSRAPSSRGTGTSPAASPRSESLSNRISWFPIPGPGPAPAATRFLSAGFLQKGD